MKKTAEVLFATATLMILIASMISPLLAQATSYNVGFREGDWIKYGQFKFVWSGNGTEPSYVTDDKKIDWMRIDVENINGTTVTMNLTLHYNNGTQTSQTGSEDVASGLLSNSTLAELNPIAANLKSGDYIFNYTLLPYPQLTTFTPPRINQTTWGIYAGAIRSVNLLLLNETYSSMNVSETITARIYWDQNTGAVVEWYEKSPQFEDNSPIGYLEISYKATETNMWSPDLIGTLYNNPVYTVTGIVIVTAGTAAIALIVMLAAILPRRKKTPTTATSASAR